MKAITAVTVTKDYAGAGTLRIDCTYAETEFTGPNQQTTIGNLPAGNPNFSRFIPVNDQGLFCSRNGAPSVALLMDSWTKIARTLEPLLSWKPVIDTEPADASAAFAKSTLTFGALPVDGKIVTLGTQAYTFKDTLGSAYDVKIDAAGGTTAEKIANTLDNLKAAVNDSGGEGTAYGNSTNVHPTIQATTNTDTTQLFEAKAAGTAPNLYATTTDVTSATFSSATLEGGTAAEVYATAVLTITGAISNTETITINGRAYTFLAALTGGTDEVKLGGTDAETLENLRLAVNRTSPSVYNYGGSTPVYSCASAHSTVQATIPTATTLTFEALAAGTVGNGYTVADMMAFGTLAAFSGGLAAAQFSVAASSEDAGSQAYLWQAEDATVKATGVLTNDTVAPENGDVVVIGDRTYTFKTALSASTTANEVLIGASAAAALDNLKAAVNGAAGAGTLYGSETVTNEQVIATTNTDTAQTFEAIEAGTAANEFATTTDSLHLSWGAPTLINGGWATASGTIDGCAYTGGTTTTLTCTPTTTGQDGVSHRCAVTNTAGTTYTESALLTLA